MKLRLFLSITAIICLSSNLHAQHNDMIFGYDDPNNPTDFLLSPLTSTTTGDGIILIPTNMEEDIFVDGEFSGDQPGFSTEAPGQGLIVNPGNSILLGALDASENSSFGVGYVNFYNPATDELEPSGRIAFKDNTIGTPDLVLDGDLIESGVNSQFISQASSTGFVHSHIRWDLLDDATAPLGAYGILVELQSDYTYDGTIDLTSDPFWIVFNHGMSEAEFQSFALPKYGVGQSDPVLLGDVNLDGIVDFSDIPSFITVLMGGGFQAEADCDGNGIVDFQDIPAFIAILIGS